MILERLAGLRSSKMRTKDLLENKFHWLQPREHGAAPVVSADLDAGCRAIGGHDAASAKAVYVA